MKVYHGTTTFYLDMITKSGLAKDSFVSPIKDDAIYYAKGKLRADERVHVWNQKPILLVLNIPRKNLTKYAMAEFYQVKQNIKIGNKIIRVT